LKQIFEADDKLITFGPAEQKDFLIRMEAQSRLENLLKSSPENEHENLKSAFEMLTSTEQMGSRFKFFSIFPRVLKEHLERFPVNGF
jgi:NADH dehydrogenase [ubiquinone] 1 alpha subcomplex assembly factor 7